jgi:hypothetical protein
MSKQQPPKSSAEQLAKVTPTESKLTLGKQEPSVAREPVVLLDSGNYKLIGIGLVIILVGFVLMSGGSMPDANTWDESIIYGFRRITLAPMVVLAGLGVVIAAIFKKYDA